MMRKVARNPDVIWREEQEARDDVIEAMERGEDASEEGTVLLMVSGMMHQLNILGGEIWKLADGTLDETGIVDRLHESFEVDRETLAADVREFLKELESKGWISYEE